ncbi:MAG: cytochrome c [Proteobacteria bacterium]|nr:cytochrome c [Pseudomonadota bacterium]
MRRAVLISLALGLVLGVIGTVMAMSALRSGPHMTSVLMHMQAFHRDALDATVKANRCASTDNLPHLQVLRMLSNDLEPIFLPVGKDADFRQKASNFRAALHAPIAAPPDDCPSLGAAMTKIDHECKSCHSEFRN